MTPIIPLDYSRKAVGRAGATLQEGRYPAEEYSQALEVLSNWRASHIYPLSKIQNLLYKRAKKVDSKALIAQRLKRTPSIINKLKLMKNSQLHRMQDIGGCRAILSDISKVYELRNNIVNKFSNHILQKEDDRIKVMAESGYRSIHLIYKFQVYKHTEFNNHLIEIQLRTKLQHAWATAVEILGTYLNEALKSSQGSKEVLGLLKKISLLFSYHEKTYDISPQSIGNLKADIANDIHDLDIVTQLRAFSVTTKTIDSKKYKDGYALLYLDTTKMVVNIQWFNKNNQQHAIDKYLEYEKESIDKSNDNIVLVSIENTKLLRKTYPNYFADSKYFISELEKLLQ